jgi:hypothetical protein
MRDKMATGDEGVLGDVLKVLGEDGFRLMTQLLNIIYETGEWSKDCVEVTMIALKKKPEPLKCSNHHTICLSAHIAKIVATILRRSIKSRIEVVLGED